MISIILNGENKEIPANSTVSALLEILAIDSTKSKIAVEINATICPRHQHQETSLKAQDKVEIITAVGGG